MASMPSQKMTKTVQHSTSRHLRFASGSMPYLDRSSSTGGARQQPPAARAAAAGAAAAAPAATPPAGAAPGVLEAGELGLAPISVEGSTVENSFHRAVWVYCRR